MKPKVTIIITRSEIGGAQNYVSSMIDVLEQQYDFNVVTGSNAYLSKSLRKRGIKVTVIRQIDSMNAFVALYRLRCLLTDNPSDLVNTHSTLASFYVRLASIGLKTPIVYSVHGWFFMNHSAWLRRKVGPLIEKTLSGLTSYWITETIFDQKIGLQTGAISSPGKSTVIPNGIPEPQKKGFKNKNSNNIRIAFIGRISKQKNPELAIQILALLPEKYSLTIFCDNAKNTALLTLIETLHLSGRTTLIDTEHCTASVIHKFDLLLVTSRYEGMPLSIIEAMCAKLPIVSSDVCGLNELVISGSNGYLIESNFPNEYAQKINSIFSDTEKLNQMKEQSRILFESKHTLTKMAKELSTTFNSLINTQ